jgi:hypothetical protein
MSEKKPNPHLLSKEELTIIKNLYKTLDWEGNPIGFLEIMRRFNKGKRKLGEQRIAGICRNLVKKGELDYIDRSANKIKSGKKQRSYY